MLAIWHQLDKSLKQFPSSSDLLKQKTLFRCGTKIKGFFFRIFFSGKKKLKWLGLIRLTYTAYFEPRKKGCKNQKKIKRFIATSSKWTVLFPSYADLTFNRKVKQSQNLWDQTVYCSSEFLQEKQMALLQMMFKWRFCSITCLAKALKRQLF